MMLHRQLMRHTLAALVALTAAALPATAASGQAPAVRDDWNTIPADQPMPRRDENSRIAHEELLAKAAEGTIDVYFVGDSITRRWGALDYPALLAHWRETFFGWNAANFAWGGDRTQHILWRLDNGELDGPTPRVIVVQAGANNIGNRPGDNARADDIARGIKAIVDRCRTKVPGAVVVLTAVFPRGDPALLPEIARINTTIAGFADGTAVRFLNINAGLAGPDGTMLESVSDDGLHLNLNGYRVWAAGLTPILSDVLGPRAAVDQAPPPTGDPSARNRTAN
jgi:lysophospholipase L1-like esterase